MSDLFLYFKYLLRIPLFLKFKIFGKSSYGIFQGYIHRNRVENFDDTKLKDEWQDEVYKHASELSAQYGYSRILDVGCGSGYKLMKYFYNLDITGVELPETLIFLNNKYPQKRWLELNEVFNKNFDLVIISDVIEHVENPSEFLSVITNTINFKAILISTPDRNLLHSLFHFGPPTNIYHCREWNFNEFRKFCSKYIHIHDHFISNKKQGTQVLVGKKLKSPINE